MNILVIGGSYFYGRVFVMEAVREHSEYHITVLNRGTYSMEEFGVSQIRGDSTMRMSIKNVREIMMRSLISARMKQGMCRAS